MRASDAQSTLTEEFLYWITPLSGSLPARASRGEREKVVPQTPVQGQGTARIAQSKADGFGLFYAERTVNPLRNGEGRGEGKEHIAPRGADVLALATGQCPQRQ